MDSTTAILIFSVSQGIIFLAILLFWVVSRRANFSIFVPRVSKVKTLLEQRLVLEAVSACANETSVEKLLNNIGDHAAEMTGYQDWIIWARDRAGNFHVADYLFSDGTRIEGLLSSEDPDLFTWVINNASPLKISRQIINFLHSEASRKAFQHLGKGIIIPFTDYGSVNGFIAMGEKEVFPKREAISFLVSSELLQRL